MVIRSGTFATILILAGPALAETPQDRMFPDATRCYARVYTAEHLARHPAQRVTELGIGPDFQFAQPRLALDVRLTLRGVPGGTFEGYGICESEGDAALTCGMEGDAGGFTVSMAKGGAVLITVGSLGMSFENDAGFATLEENQGDDRSFLLRPSPCR